MSPDADSLPSSLLASPRGYVLPTSATPVGRGAAGAVTFAPDCFREPVDDGGMGTGSVEPSVDLFWLPLGAGGHFVRWNGRLYEGWSAWREHRAPADLYHCGLMLGLDDTRFAVEMGPVWNVTDADRGVIVEGPVGSRWLGRFRAFRYEMRCWPGGRIPDVAEAVDSPVCTTNDPATVQAVLADRQARAMTSDPSERT